MKKMTPYENLQKNIRILKTPEIEVWENKYPDRDYIITIENSEFSCVCPKTGLPDFASIIIQYKPDRHCVELKSFKMYMLFFRDIGIFHEHVVNKVLDDFVKWCKPRWAEIKGEFNTRGGIKTIVVSEYSKRNNGK
jgi:7-cyano-7-deazaguanine reductase